MRVALLRLSPYLAGFFFITTIGFFSLAVYRGEMASSLKEDVLYYADRARGMYCNHYQQQQEKPD